VENEARTSMDILLVPSSVLSLPTSWIQLGYYAHRENDVSVAIGLARSDDSMQVCMAKLSANDNYEINRSI